MNCPACDSRKVRVSTTRQDTCESLIRERFCSDCAHRWCSVEIEIPRESFSYTYDGLVRRLQGFRKITFS
jgi:transcriptional regulator NrdR family protein